MVEVFFQLASKWSKWCTQTLHLFSKILKIFPHIRTSIVAPPSDNFENCFIGWKRLFFRKKTAPNRIYIGLQMPTLCLVEVTQLRTKAVHGRQRYFQTRNKSNLLRVNAIPAGPVYHYPLSQQKKSCLPVHVAQKITVHAQKIGKFAV